MIVDKKEYMRLYMRSYSKKYRLSLKQKGLCLNCHKTKAAPNRTCCESCLIKKRVSTMHRTHANIGNWIEVKLISQGGKCAICNGVMARVNIDHSHKTGKRRGLLCTSCNTSLGKFKDSPEILMNAINYLLLFE